MKELFDLEIEEMLGLKYNCECGHCHGVGIEDIIVGNGVIDKLPDLLAGYKGKKVLIIEDINTYLIAGKTAEEILVKDFVVSKHIFKENNFIPDERALGRLLIEVQGDAEILVAIGSGSINDITRYMSYKLNIPYIIVCTAPSMDGYASVVSPLIIDGVKTTYEAVYPKAILADIDILKTAPMYMLQAGLGDILGKYTAIADWNIARILNEEYFCDSVSTLIMKVVDRCVKASVNLLKRDDETIKDITEALILSGLAIGMVGASRPASGEEHHLSHCWEMLFMDRGIETKWLHGNNVGVGVGIIIEAYKYLNTLSIKDISQEGAYADFEMNKWEDNLRAVYGKNGNKVIEFKKPSISVSREAREKKMSTILSHWSEITAIGTELLPEAQEVREVLKNAGGISTPQELGLDRETFKRSFIAAKDIRNRYGVLQLLEDIGKLETAAEVIAEVYYS